MILCVPKLCTLVTYFLDEQVYTSQMLGLAQMVVDPVSGLSVVSLHWTTC